MNDLDELLSKPVDEYTATDIDKLIELYRDQRAKKGKTGDEAGPVIPLAKLLNLKPKKPVGSPLRRI